MTVIAPETRTIGSLQVFAVGLGCNNFGARLDQAATTAVVDAALDAGVNFFDTADVYGGTRSEEFLGRALGARRRGVVVATKFGLRIDDARPGGGRPEYVRRAAEDSLRRLGTDVIDLYQMHRPDPAVPIADTMGALDDLVREGKVREAGCSNFSVDQIRASRTVQTEAQFASVQNEYSLFHREPERDGVLAECERERLGFLPYFPLASGLLSGKYRRGAPPPPDTRFGSVGWGKERLTEESLARVERLAGVARERGYTVLELAIAWLLARPAVVSVIAGATSAEQVQANAAAAAWRMDQGDLAAVEQALAAD